LELCCYRVYKLRYSTYGCVYMYFRFDRRHLNFLMISASVTIDKDLLQFTQKNITYNVILFSHVISHIRVVFATIWQILDEFRQSKLLLWRHAYWGHVMLRSWNQCRPVENLFVHKFIENLCHISSKKSYTATSVLRVISPICNIGVNISALKSKLPVNVKIYSNKRYISVEHYKLGIHFSWWSFYLKCSFQKCVCRPLSFWRTTTIALPFDRSLPKLVETLRLRFGTHRWRRKCMVAKIQDGGRSHFWLKKTVAVLTDHHQI